MDLITGKMVERRPFEGEFDETTKVLIDMLNNVSLELGKHWSFAGGFARDNYFGVNWNDYDICMQRVNKASNILEKIGVLNKANENTAMEDAIPHDYFIDPYDFSGKKHPLHWIEANDEFAFAPEHFDFSINHICLKPDGFYYAPAHAWHDIDNKILRKVSDKMTTNMIMRAIRFASKLDLKIEQKLSNQIKEHVSSNQLGNDIILRNTNKMIEDGVGDKCFEYLKMFKVEGAHKTSDIENFAGYHHKRIILGTNYTEPITHRYS